MKRHIQMVTPAVLMRARDSKTNAGCEQYSDAAVCGDGTKDVQCPEETYRGCGTGQTDCADSDGNPDDVCCFGSSMFGVGDNIDHAFCRERDAGFGGVSPCWWGWDSNEPENDDWWP